MYTCLKIHVYVQFLQVLNINEKIEIHLPNKEYLMIIHLKE